MDSVEEKRKAFLRREKFNKEQDRIANKTYHAPTDVQFDVKTYNDLNPANKIKLEKFLKTAQKRNLPYNVELVMHEIRKYDTSVLDHLLRFAFY